MDAGREGRRAPRLAYHLTEYFGPVLGIMTARTLEEAIEMQNQVEYGLTAGLHSLDPDELQLWLDRVQAGNLYVNRGTTGAIVRRQPFGGWKKSAVGPGTKAGGPNYLVGLSDWKPARSTATAARFDPSRAPHRRGAPVEAAGYAVASLERAAASDAAAWATEYGAARDVSGLEAERNVLRYSPVPVAVRLAEGGSVGDLLRVVAAGSRAGACMTVSSGVDLPRPVVEAIIILGIPLRSETDRQWYSGLAHAVGPGARHRRGCGCVRRGDRRPPRRRALRRPGHRVRPARDAAVPARAGGEHHRPPLRQPVPADRPHLVVE